MDVVVGDDAYPVTVANYSYGTAFAIHTDSSE
jgi:hypothetical protein